VFPRQSNHCQKPPLRTVRLPAPRSPRRIRRRRPSRSARYRFAIRRHAFIQHGAAKSIVATRNAKPPNRACDRRRNGDDIIDQSQEHGPARSRVTSGTSRSARELIEISFATSHALAEDSAQRSGGRISCPVPVVSEISIGCAGGTAPRLAAIRIAVSNGGRPDGQPHHRGSPDRRRRSPARRPPSNCRSVPR